MTDPRGNVEQLARLKRYLEPDLGDQDVERLIQGGAERRQRRRIRRTLGTGLVLGAAGTALIASFLRWSAMLGGDFEPAPPVASAQQATHHTPTAPVHSASSTPETFTLGDQSRATALGLETRLAVEEDAVSGFVCGSSAVERASR